MSGDGHGSSPDQKALLKDAEGPAPISDSPVKIEMQEQLLSQDRLSHLQLSASSQYYHFTNVIILVLIKIQLFLGLEGLNLLETVKLVKPTILIGETRY